MGWQQLLFQIARSRLSRGLVGWIFAHMSWVIPVKRLRETDTLIAFYHPSPSYPTHILIVPKIARPNIESISATDSNFLLDIFATVNELTTELQLSAYRLICNGGDYQDIPQLHFHLVSENKRKDAQ